MADISISDVSGRRTQSQLSRILVSQEFWVTIAVVLMALWLVINTDAFDTWRNLRNAMLNMAFIGIIALGQSCVIITAGIDLSVGSVMAVGAVGTGLMMTSGWGIELAFIGGLLAAMAVGLFNGVLVAFVKLPPFVVTLGTLSICRTISMVATNNQLIYEFGDDQQALFDLGTGGIGTVLGIESDSRLLDTPFPFVVMVVLTVVLSYFLYLTRWGRHIFAVGGNEHAARLTGVPVAFIKVSAYVFCSATAGLSGILMMGWAGSLNNSIGLNYELRVIASTVIGGANLMGGYASAYGAFIGAALLEILRNSLVLLKIDTNYHLGFLGLFIIFAVLLERMRDSRIKPSALMELFFRRPR